MAREPASRLQVSGYRFLLRRMEHALQRRDVRMVDDPMRAQSASMVAGCLAAAVIAGGCAVLAFVRPHAAIGDAPIVAAQDSGALYVRVGDVLHPVLNLASARLIAGVADNPRRVAEPNLTSAKHGPLLGIPGAPPEIGEPLRPDESAWTVCDAAGSAAPSATTVIVGPVQGSVLGRPVLVVAGTTTYLLYDGHRAVVDLTDRATVRALYLESVVPLPVSLLLLNAIPELPPIRPPLIPDAGRPSAFVGFPVGSVVRIPRAESVENYVVLANGVQRIGTVAADLIRFANSHGDREVISVAPDAIASSPVVDVLPVSTFPETAAPARGSSGLAVMCLTWTPDRTSFLAGKELPLAAGQAPRSLAQADGAGPALDAVFVPPGRTACVHGQTRYLVTDTGVRFAVPDDEAARDLGLDATGSPAPWPVLAALPEGPELSKANALVARDTVTAAGPRKP